MSQPAISVLLPVYNGAAHLQQALDSILAQHETDFELIVIDDGSTDATPQLLAAVNDPRLIVLRQDNAGIVAALNAGLARARGRYIARMDADDIALPERLALQRQFLDANPAVVACGMRAQRFGAASGDIAVPLGDRGCRARLLFGSCFVHPTVMLRAGVLARAGLRYEADALYAEDYRLWLALAQHGELVNLPQLGLRYRVHPGQTGQEKRRQQRAAHARVMALAWQARGIEVEARALAALLWPEGRGLAPALRYLAAQWPLCRRAWPRLGGARLRLLYRVLHSAAAILRGRHVH